MSFEYFDPGESLVPLALCSLATLAASAKLIRKFRVSQDRFLVGFAILVAVQSILRFLTASGLIGWHTQFLHGFANLLVSLQLLLALFLMRAYRQDFYHSRMHVRWLEANRKRPAAAPVGPARGCKQEK